MYTLGLLWQIFDIETRRNAKNKTIIHIYVLLNLPLVNPSKTSIINIIKKYMHIINLWYLYQNKQHNVNIKFVYEFECQLRRNVTTNEYI